MIALKCRALREKERGEIKREYGRIWGEEEEGDAVYGGVLTAGPSQQDIAPHEKGSWVEKESSTRCLDWTSVGSPELDCRDSTGDRRSPTPYTRCHLDLTPFSRLNTTRREDGGRILLLAHRGDGGGFFIRRPQA